MRQNVEVPPESVSDAPARRPSLRERVFGRERPRPPERTEDREDEESEKRLREAAANPERGQEPRPAERADHPDYFEPATVAKRTLASGLVTGGVLAGGSALLALSGGAGAPVIIPAMIKAGIGGAIAGGSTYLGGETHNLLWKKKGQERPGPVGTFLRGLVSGITVPVGLAYRLIKGRDRESAPESRAA